MDTCGTAGDGVCQDGGWAASGSMCELGTDCSDCGARPAAVPVLDPAPAPPLPPGVAGVGGVATSGGEATSVGGEAASVSGATQDAGSGLAIGLAITAIGLALLVAMLGTGIFVWQRKRCMQPPPSTASPQQVEVVVTQPESNK